MEPMKPFTAQADTPPVPDAFDAESARYATPGWSWGGFMAWQMFAIGLRKYRYLLLILPGLIPYIGPLLMLGVMIYFGMNGREMAANSVTFSSREQYIGFMKGADHAGKVFFFAGLVLVVLFLTVGFGLGGLLGSQSTSSVYMEDQDIREIEALMREIQQREYPE